METKRYNILTNRTDGFTYEDFVDYCKEENWDMDEEDLVIPSENSEEYYDWLYEMVDDNYFADECAIKTCKSYNVRVVVEGSLGLWDGIHEIVPKEFDSVWDAIEKCIGRDMSYIDVEYEDGIIYVSVSHHDGVNYFTITAKEGKLPYLYDIGVE